MNLAMFKLSRNEINIVAMAAVVFASITYKFVDKVLGMLPIVNTFIPDMGSDGCPSTLGFIVHVVVFAAAVKFVLPRM